MDLLTIAIILFLVGVALGTAEIFIPSAGALAVLCVLAFVGSIACAFRVSAMWGMGFLAAAPVVMAVVIIKGFNILPRTRIGKRLILAAPDDDPSGSDQAESDAAASMSNGSDDGAVLVGKTGVSRTELRPSGSAQIGDRRYDVVSAGDYIRKGAPVRVIEVRGNRIVVEEDTES